MRFRTAGWVATFATMMVAVPDYARATSIKPRAPTPREAAPAKSAPVQKASLATKPEPQAATAVTAPKATPKRKRAATAPTLAATIDLTSQRMTVRAGGKTLHSWKISSGRRGYETPPGRFRPKWMAADWYSRKYDMAPMPYSVFFNGGIATHGTTAVSRLGRPASHGCIRLKTANARTFYRLVRRHGMKRTRITVTGKTPYVAPRHAKTRRSVSRRRRVSVGRTRIWSRHAPRTRQRTARPRRVFRFRYVQPRPSYTYRAYRRPRLVYPGDRPRIVYRRVY